MEPSASSRVDGLRYKETKRRTYAGVRVWEGGCLSLPVPMGFEYFCPVKSIDKINNNLSFFNRAYHNTLNKILLYERVNDYDRNGCEHDTSGL